MTDELNLQWAPPATSEEVDVVDEDWLAGVSCNSETPEECESCQ